MKVYVLICWYLNLANDSSVSELAGIFMCPESAKTWTFDDYRLRPFYNEAKPAKFIWDVDKKNSTNTVWHDRWMFHYEILERDILDWDPSTSRCCA